MSVRLVVARQQKTKPPPFFRVEGVRASAVRIPQEFAYRLGPWRRYTGRRNYIDRTARVYWRPTTC
jgi:hypothetical protein